MQIRKRRNADGKYKGNGKFKTCVDGSKYRASSRAKKELLVPTREVRIVVRNRVEADVHLVDIAQVGHAGGEQHRALRVDGVLSQYD